MRKIIMALSVSLDGFISGPDGEIDWHLVDDELHSFFNENLRKMSAFLDGRVNHELMASYWPTADADPTASAPEVEFAGIWRDMPKIVYSRTLQEAGWNTEIKRRVDPDEVRALKAQPGGDMAIGGADLAASFIEHNLIDEFWLYVNPVVLGGGKPFFPLSERRIQLQLVQTRGFGNGVVLLRYGRSPSPD